MKQFKMFWLVIAVCLNIVYGAESSVDETTEIDNFERYAGNLTYSNNQDGSCIACREDANDHCTRDTVVSPHSWTAKLEDDKDNMKKFGTLETCQEYAHDVSHLGVVAFTWKNSTRTCSLHVKKSQEDIGAAMVFYNGFNWTEEYPDNEGPLYLVRYPSLTEEVDAVCYYGLDINNYPNIVVEANFLIMLFVVFVITAWNVWMYHTDNYPPKSFDYLQERQSSIYKEDKEPHAKKH